jgi:hypothetical protein
LAKGGEYWKGSSHRGSAGWFASAQAVCDAYLPNNSKAGFVPKKTFTFGEFPNSKRRHQSLDRQTPDSVYYQTAIRKAA